MWALQLNNAANLVETLHWRVKILRLLPLCQKSPIHLLALIVSPAQSLLLSCCLHLCMRSRYAGSCAQSLLNTAQSILLMTWLPCSLNTAACVTTAASALPFCVTESLEWYSQPANRAAGALVSHSCDVQWPDRSSASTPGLSLCLPVAFPACTTHHHAWDLPAEFRMTAVHTAIPKPATSCLLLPPQLAY